MAHTMNAIDATELWRQVPPEEKFELMSRSHAKGIWAAFIVILLGSTLAVGFKADSLMWSSFLISPVVFQLAAGKAWRNLRPAVMLEYLAVRSAARRYAFSNNAKDLSLELVFRATAHEVVDEENGRQALELAFAKRDHESVWITLFKDSLILISECAGGAELRFAHLIDERLHIEGYSPESGSEYGTDRQVTITAIPKGAVKGKGAEAGRRIRLTSKYPAALVVFEKRLAQLLEDRQKEQKALLPDPIVDDLEKDEDLFWKQQAGA